LILLLGSLIVWRMGQKRAETAARGSMQAARGKAPASVELATVSLRDIVNTFETTGTVESPLSVKITPKISGLIEYLQVHEGDWVHKGQVLVRIDPSLAQEEVQQQMAALATAQYRLAQAQLTQAPTDVGVTTQIRQQEAAVLSARANLDNATAKYNRANELYKKGYVAAQEVDDAKMELAASNAKLQQAEASLESSKANSGLSPAYKANIAALRAGVDAARAALAGAKTKLADTTLKAPFEGLVSMRYLDPGGLAMPGQPILEIQSVDRVWVSFSVPEKVCSKLALGQQATVQFDSYPNQTFPASIVQINPAADPASRQFVVRVALDNAQRLFKPGMFALVTVVTARREHTLAVPREAIQQDKELGASVMVVDASGKVARHPVSVGMSDANLVEILKGLIAGEKVVTMSTMPLRDGQAVRAAGGRGAGGRGGIKINAPAARNLGREK
jgi:multidrug efflux pump subunit AcrA (membrane-fusion protein)